MSRTLTTAMNNALLSEVMTLCLLWRITRLDGVVLGFTDHDQPVILGGVTYQPTTGFSPTAIASSASLAVDNLDVVALLDDAAISEADLVAGLYDGAVVDILQVDWNAPDAGSLILAGGWSLGKVTIRRGQFTAELRSKAQRLQQTIGQVYSRSCRAHFCDAKCGFDAEDVSSSGTVTGISTTEENACLFLACATLPLTGVVAGATVPARYVYGVVTFTSGQNDGYSVEVKVFNEATMGILFFSPTPYPVALGDEFTIRWGCDKSFSTCRDVFQNAINFRGEPFVPGTDKLLDYAS